MNGHNQHHIGKEEEEDGGVFDPIGVFEVPTDDADRVEVRPEDHYGFPYRWLSSGIYVNGYPVFRCPVKIPPATHTRKMMALPMREDDVVLTGFVKSGNHWMVEILHMLTAGTTEYSQRLKEHDQLEFVNDLEALDTLPSPRVLNTNVYMAHLPQQIPEKRVKIVHVLRNPKDTLVSLYFHMKQKAKSNFTLDNLIKGYVQDFYLYASHQFDFLRQIDNFIKANPGHPVMHVQYEDLKKDSVSVIRDLAKFLELDVSDDFCQQVADAVRFDAMKKIDHERDPPQDVLEALKGKLKIYRKGEVGDWKNHLTVAQNEILDAFISAQEKKGVSHTFRYE